MGLCWKTVLSDREIVIDKETSSRIILNEPSFRKPTQFASSALKFTRSKPCRFAKAWVNQNYSVRSFIIIKKLKLRKSSKIEIIFKRRNNTIWDSKDFNDLFYCKFPPAKYILCCYLNTHKALAIHGNSQLRCQLRWFEPLRMPLSPNMNSKRRPIP